MQGQYIQDAWCLDYTATAQCYNGDIVKLPNGQAGICQSDIAAGALGSVRVRGIVKVGKTASVAMLQGGDAYWDVSASLANYKADVGTPDFYIGSVDQDAAGSDSYVYVNLNNIVRHDIDYARAGEQDGWTSTKTNSPTGYQINSGATGVPVAGVSGLVLAATNEAEALYLLSNRTFVGATKGIAEFRLTEVAASDNTVDIDFGIASGGHASDFETVTAFVAFHRDGGDAVIDTHSDDNTTDNAPATSGVSLTQSTYNEYWIDFRDSANVKFYIDGVLVDTSSSKRVLTGAAATAMGIAIMIEKSAGTATGEIRWSKARARIAAE